MIQKHTTKLQKQTTSHKHRHAFTHTGKHATSHTHKQTVTNTDKQSQTQTMQIKENTMRQPVCWVFNFVSLLFLFKVKT